MPIGNITQSVSTIPAPPHRGVDVQTVFVNKQEDFQDHLADTTIDELNTLKDQLNSRIGEINSTTTTMNGYADTASAGASTATTKAAEASTSVSQALTYRNQASTSAAEAAASASTATTNTLISENNAKSSELLAQRWAENAEDLEVITGEYSAYHWARKAQAVASGDVIDDAKISNLLTWSSTKINSLDVANVKLSGNQTINGKKVFTDRPIVPSPIEDNHVVNKEYVDSKYSGFKNYIINGGFDIWQRKGTAQTTYIDNFTADRFKCTTVKDGISHYSFLSSKVSNRANMPVDYMAIVLQDTNSNRVEIKQRIEKSAFTNKNVGDYFTLSFYMGHSGVASHWNASSSFDLKIYAPTTIDTYATTTLELAHSFGTMQTLPEFGTKYKKTFQLTQNMISYGMEINLSLYAPVGTAVGAFNSTIRFAQVQLEEGSIATPFEQRPYGLELSLCQRYYQNIYVYNFLGVNQWIRDTVYLPVSMRTVPTLSNFTVSVGGTYYTCSLYPSTNNTNSFSIISSGDTIGGDLAILASASAEL